MYYICMATVTETRPDVEFVVAPRERPAAPKPRETIESLYTETREVSPELIDTAETLPWDTYMAFGEEVTKKIFGSRGDKELITNHDDGTFITNTGALVIPGSVPMPRAELLMTQPTRSYIENNMGKYTLVKLGRPKPEPEAWRKAQGEEIEELPAGMSVKNIAPDTYRSRSRSVTNPDTLKGSRVADLMRKGYSKEQIADMKDSEIEELSDVGKSDADEVPTYTGVRLLTDITANALASENEESGFRLESETDAITPETLDKSLRSVDYNYSRIIEEAAPALDTLLMQESYSRRLEKSPDNGTYLGSILYTNRKYENFRPVVISSEVIVLVDRRAKGKGRGETIILKNDVDEGWKGAMFELGKDIDAIDNWMEMM
jgi:hypothetical protein